MNTLTKNLADPSWWMTVVVFGILINVIAAYLKPAIDKLGAMVYPRLRGAVGQKAVEFEAEVQSLRASSEHRVATQLLKIEFLVKVIGGWLLSIQLYAAAYIAKGAGAFYLVWPLYMSAVLAGLYSSGCIGRYLRLAQTLSRARQAEPSAPAVATHVLKGQA